MLGNLGKGVPYQLPEGAPNIGNGLFKSPSDRLKENLGMDKWIGGSWLIS